MRTLRKAKSQFVKLFQYDASNQNRVNLLDVKALYDAAYAEKDAARAALKNFQHRLEQAQTLDALYRAQIKADVACLYRKAV